MESKIKKPDHWDKHYQVKLEAEIRKYLVCYYKGPYDADVLMTCVMRECRGTINPYFAFGVIKNFITEVVGMDLLLQLKADRVAAMKAGNKTEKEYLTVFLGDLESDAKRGTEITDTLIVSKIKKNIQNCLANFSISDQQKYVDEADFFNRYLPKMVSDEEVLEFIKNSKANGNDTMGGIMKALKETYGQFLDGKRASQLVKESL